MIAFIESIKHVLGKCDMDYAESSNYVKDFYEYAWSITPLDFSSPTLDNGMSIIEYMCNIHDMKEGECISYINSMYSIGPGEDGIYRQSVPAWNIDLMTALVEGFGHRGYRRDTDTHYNWKVGVVENLVDIKNDCDSLFIFEPQIGFDILVATIVRKNWKCLAAYDVVPYTDLYNRFFRDRYGICVDFFIEDTCYIDYNCISKPTIVIANDMAKGIRNRIGELQKNENVIHLIRNGDLRW